MVGIVVAAEGVARIQRTVQGQVKMVLVDKAAQVSGAHELLLLAQRVVQVERVKAELVRHDHIDVIGHAAGHPVVAADGLEPPDLVHILERDAIHLVGAVLLQQTAKAPDALARGADIGQDQIDNVLLADAALDERVSAQHARVGGNGLGSRHADVGRVDAAGRPQALALNSVGYRGDAQAAAGQGDLDARNDGFIDCGVVLRLKNGEFFGSEMAGAGIVVAGDHRGPVVGRIFADQNGGASHG